MKKLLSLSLALSFVCAVAFAQQESGGSKNGGNKTGLAKIADVMTTSLCDCFNEHGLKKLTPTAREAIGKLVKNKVESLDNLETVLNKSEIEALGKEMQGFGGEGSDFDKCSKESQGKLANYATELMEAMSEVGGDEDAFQKKFQDEMVKVMQKGGACKTFYYFYLIGLKQGGE